MGKSCVFLDRDGVINLNAAPHEYIRSAAEFQLIPQIADWIQLFHRLGYLVIVITNQRGIARGLMTERDLEAVHAKMMEELRQRGARVDDIFYCPHEEGTCDCRKPLPGMIHKAVEKWDIDLSRSVLVGDSRRDRDLAIACGLTFIPVSKGHVVEQLEEV